MHDGMPYGRNQGQGQGHGHSREVGRQSPTGLIFIIATAGFFYRLDAFLVVSPTVLKHWKDHSNSDWCCENCCVAVITPVDLLLLLLLLLLPLLPPLLQQLILFSVWFNWPVIAVITPGWGASRESLPEKNLVLWGLLVPDFFTRQMPLLSPNSVKAAWKEKSIVPVEHHVFLGKHLRTTCLVHWSTICSDACPLSCVSAEACFTSWPNAQGRRDGEIS